jgi:hypothetical protein
VDINWFLSLETDGLITAWVKANVILVSVLGVLLRYFVKKTPSTDDDALLDDLKRVLPMLKRK